MHFWKIYSAHTHFFRAGKKKYVVFLFVYKFFYEISFIKLILFKYSHDTHTHLYDIYKLCTQESQYQKSIIRKYHNTHLSPIMEMLDVTSLSSIKHRRYPDSRYGQHAWNSFRHVVLYFL